MPTQTKVARSRLIVAYFPRSASADDLQGVFGQHVAVLAARIIRDRNGDSRCYGFVDFLNFDDASSARNACLRGDVRLVDEKAKTWYLKAEHANAMQWLKSRARQCDASSCSRGECNIDASRNQHLAELYYASAPNTLQEHHLRVEDYFQCSRSRHPAERGVRNTSIPQERHLKEVDNFGDSRYPHINKRQYDLREACLKYLEQDKVGGDCRKSKVEPRRSGGGRRVYNSCGRCSEEDQSDDSWDQHLTEHHYAGGQRNRQIFKEAHFTRVGNENNPEGKYFGRSCITHMPEGFRFREDDRFDVRGNRNLPQNGNAGVPRITSITVDDLFEDPRMECVPEDYHYGGSDRRYAIDDVHRIHSRVQCGFVDGEPSRNSECRHSFGDFAGEGYPQNNIGARCQQNEFQVVYSL